MAVMEIKITLIKTDNTQLWLVIYMKSLRFTHDWINNTTKYTKEYNGLMARMQNKLQLGNKWTNEWALRRNVDLVLG